jgi:hypothetical protein
MQFVFGTLEHMGDSSNIVVFFTDQQRWDTCGCYRGDGHPAATDETGYIGNRRAEHWQKEPHVLDCSGAASRPLRRGRAGSARNEP